MPDKVQYLYEELDKLCYYGSDGKVIGYRQVPPIELMQKLLEYLKEQISEGYS